MTVGYHTSALTGFEFSITRVFRVFDRELRKENQSISCTCLGTEEKEPEEEEWKKIGFRTVGL